MSERPTKRFTTSPFSRGASEKQRRDADLFWETLFGAPDQSAQRFLRPDARRWPRARGEALDVASSLEGLVEVDDGANRAEEQPLADGPTASPCDISKKSETIDGFAPDAPRPSVAWDHVLTHGQMGNVRRLADCILALRGSPRPIRELDFVGATDPSGPSAAYNEALGLRRANVVRDALVVELNTRVPGSAASLVLRTRSIGARQQLPGGWAVNRRVEVFVAIAVTNLVVHPSTPDTHKIASNRGAAGLEHFVCVKGMGDIVLAAEISPDIPGAADARLTWAATGTAIRSPAISASPAGSFPNPLGSVPVGLDARTARLSSAAVVRAPIEVKIDGAVVRRAVVWVIWSNITVTETRPPTMVDPMLLPPGVVGIKAGIDHSFAIDPPTITPLPGVPADADRPALDGSWTALVPGASRAHVISNQLLLAGAGIMFGAHKWDASRQLRMRILNPQLYTPAQLVAVPGRLWSGQPVANTVPEDYPVDDALGNDDARDTDEPLHDPYASAGVMTSFDNPQMAMRNATGADGDTFESRFHFREFLRINLEDRWYRASDFSLWRFHAVFRREGGVWKDHGSVLARDNAGF
jgi:hypothetical protein